MEDEQDLALQNDRCNLLFWEATELSCTESGLEYAFGVLFFTPKVTPKHFIYYFFSVIWEPTTHCRATFEGVRIWWLVWLGSRCIGRTGEGVGDSATSVTLRVCSITDFGHPSFSIFSISNMYIQFIYLLSTGIAKEFCLQLGEDQIYQQSSSVKGNLSIEQTVFHTTIICKNSWDTILHL